MEGKRQATDESGPLTLAKRARVDDGGSQLALSQQQKAQTLAAAGAAEVPRTSSLQAPTMLLSGHADAVLSVKFAPDGKSLASGSRDKNVYLWNVQGDCKVRAPHE